MSKNKFNKIMANNRVFAYPSRRDGEKLYYNIYKQN